MNNLDSSVIEAANISRLVAGSIWRMELNNDHIIFADAEGNTDLAIVDSSEHDIVNNNNNNQRMPLEVVEISMPKKECAVEFFISDLIKLENEGAVILDTSTFNKVRSKRHKNDYLQLFRTWNTGKPAKGMCICVAFDTNAITSVVSKKKLAQCLRKHLLAWKREMIALQINRVIKLCRMGVLLLKNRKKE